MNTPSRAIATFVLIVAGAVLLASCGGSSDETVAQVTGVGSISKTMLEHWMPVEAAVLYEEYPSKPVPKGVMPDPPAYQNCISFLKGMPQKLVESGPKPTVAQLRTKCAQRYEFLRVLTLNTLITWDWTIGQGLESGIKVSGTQAKERLAEVNKRYFPKAAQFARYLRLTNQTLSDMLFRSKVQEVEVKLADRQNQLTASLPKRLSDRQRQGELAKLAASMNSTKRWVAKTSCAKGYVVSACKEYTGPEAPGVPN